MQIKICINVSCLHRILMQRVVTGKQVKNTAPLLASPAVAVALALHVEGTDHLHCILHSNGCWLRVCCCKAG